MAHTVLITYTVGDNAMNKFGICFRWRNEHFFIIVFHLTIRKAAMNAQRLWKFAKNVLPTLARAQ